MTSTEERDLDQFDAPTPPKVLITGTGRAGTTLLVRILTDLGLDTGFSTDTPIDLRSMAGLEASLVDPNGPRIVKSPTVIRELGALLDDGAVEIGHVIIPIRDLDVAAASRVRLTRYGSDLHTWGGLMGTWNATRQRQALALLEYELLYTIARHDLDHTLLLFPRFAHDWEYTFSKLSFLDPTLSPERWRDALRERVRPELIHEDPLSRAERALTVAGTSFNRGVAYPVRNARKLLRRRSETRGSNRV